MKKLLVLPLLMVLLLALLIWFLHFGSEPIKWAPDPGAAGPVSAIPVLPSSPPAAESSPTPETGGDRDAVQSSRRREMRTYLQDPDTDVTALLDMLAGKN